MAVVRAQIQTVEEIYELVWTAVANKQPVEAIYQGRLRLLCPHRLGRNRERRLRALCYQLEAKAGADCTVGVAGADWRCIALDKLSQSRVNEGAWRTAPTSSRQNCW